LGSGSGRGDCDRFGSVLCAGRVPDGFAEDFPGCFADGFVSGEDVFLGTLLGFAAGLLAFFAPELFALAGALAVFAPAPLAASAGAAPIDLVDLVDLVGAVVVAGDFLEGAFLEGTFLEGAFLEGAFLEGTFLEGAFLEGAFLEGAFSAGVVLDGAFLAAFAGDFVLAVLAIVFPALATSLTRFAGLPRVDFFSRKGWTDPLSWDGCDPSLAGPNGLAEAVFPRVRRGGCMVAAKLP